MKLTIDNYKKYVPEKDQNIFESLLIDLEELNQKLIDKEYNPIFIDIQDYHNEYSPERTDPCPDYYGYYRLYSELHVNDNIGFEMTIDELDSALCILINFVEFAI